MISKTNRRITMAAFQISLVAVSTFILSRKDFLPTQADNWPHMMDDVWAGYAGVSLALAAIGARTFLRDREDKLFIIATSIFSWLLWSSCAALVLGNTYGS